MTMTQATAADLRQHPAWLQIKAAATALQPLQSKNGSIEDVESALEALAAAELTEKLPRRPGQSQDRWRQLLGAESAADAEPPRSTNVESVTVTQSPLEERVARLEQQVAELQRALEDRRTG